MSPIKYMYNINYSFVLWRPARPTPLLRYNCVMQCALVSFHLANERQMKSFHSNASLYPPKCLNHTNQKTTTTSVWSLKLLKHSSACKGLSGEKGRVARQNVGQSVSQWRSVTSFSEFIPTLVPPILVAEMTPCPPPPPLWLRLIFAKARKQSLYQGLEKR